MDHEDLDLVALVEPMVKELQRRYADLAIDLRLDVLVAPVRANGYWLHLAIRELLDNAVRFRPVPTGRIDVTVGDSEDRWRVSILDDGLGIHPKNHGQLFKRVARIETEATAHLVGFGIGLYIVQEVARAHHRPGTVDSRPGASSGFRVPMVKRVKR